MKIFMLMMVFSLLLSTLLLLLGKSLMMKSNLDRMKSSPFECGFTPRSLPRMPLSLRFFLIALIFLVFDVEIVLIFPLISTIKLSLFIYNINLFLVFAVLLISGLFYEINQGSLNWAK